MIGMVNWLFYFCDESGRNEYWFWFECPYEVSYGIGLRSWDDKTKLDGKSNFS